MCTDKINILIIDDSIDDRDLFTRILKKHDPIDRIYEAEDADEGLNIFQSNIVDCVLVDFNLPQKNGLEVLNELITLDHHLPVIVLTGQGNEEIAVDAMKRGAQDYLIKDKNSLEVHLYNSVLNSIEKTKLKRNLQVKTAELAVEKELLTVTLRSIGDGVITTNTEGFVVFMNKIAESLTGWNNDDAVGRPILDVFNCVNEKSKEAIADPIAAVMNTGIIVPMESNAILIHRDNSVRYVADSCAPIINDNNEIIGVVLVFQDVTEKIKMENELLKIQKLESIGILAGGIAHDFNNLLSGIIGNITLAKMRTTASDKIYKVLSEAEKITLIAKELTQQLLTFSTGGAPIKTAVSSEELIRNTVKFSSHGLNIKCKQTIPSDLWSIEVDEGQFNQVLQNLIINAAQAMPDGGAISIEAENIVVDQNLKLPLLDGKYIVIKVIDYGVGISDKVISKIFDPFYTTKPQGNGLGLATVFSIIRNHDGYIKVKSQEGKGSTFYIYLPAFSRKVKKKEARDEISVRGTGKILVMDDESFIREIIGEFLEGLGYSHEYAIDGEEAIELYKTAIKCGEPFDVVILDLTIAGGLGGKETIRELLTIDPRVKAIVSSGYCNDPIMSDYKAWGFKNIITKPYSLEDLSSILSSVLTEN